jgi:ferredoxin
VCGCGLCVLRCPEQVVLLRPLERNVFLPVLHGDQRLGFLSDIGTVSPHALICECALSPNLLHVSLEVNRLNEQMNHAMRGPEQWSLISRKTR